ncbi:MAG: ABC transporter permease [Bacteroidales bacterium]|nr:ABC transporter permease [Bacteroidales bacterium]
MTRADSFIASRIKFKGRVSVWATAISAFIMIVSVSVASGYRKALHDAISDIVSDVVLTDTAAIRLTPELKRQLDGIEGIAGYGPVIIEAGIVRSGEVLEGVVFKGVPQMTGSLQVRVPEKLARKLRIGVGDQLLSYFVGDRVKLRKFTVAEVYTPAVELDEALIVYCPLADMQRLLGYSADQAGAVEIRLTDDYRTRGGMMEMAGVIGYSTGLRAAASSYRYGNLFDWMQLIDMNVVAILLLMALVAAFNMISGLLIMIMRSTPTIGTLKALGMADRGIARTFLRVASRSTVLGLAAGTAAALLFCLVQGLTHIIKLDPSNYFVSYVPVSLNVPAILVTDLLAWAVIMLLLLIPARQISRIDPAQSVKGETL